MQLGATAPGPDGPGPAGAVVEPSPVLPIGNRCLHACPAAVNFGEFGSTPEPGVILSCTLPPLGGGSGKFGSPWVRMHWAKATARLNTPTLLTRRPVDVPVAFV